ncbi:MAG TPA: LytTR family DNA-binding domain-containing protein [Chitinophagaceae bacterium]|jgi:two-component system LytT family response regulator|nr:LytTR family DNA-binding domain-containing protein [Chitinophagaceae bacterium]
MIRAVHIEDEPRNIELLQTLIRTHCSDMVSLEGHAKDINEAITLIRDKKPQLVYLDIELNRGNAFELLEKLKESGEFNFTVIFITAFNDYAVKAFRYHAVDYLLKPISIEELKEATAKAAGKIKQQQGNENILGLLNQLKDNMGTQKIGLPVTDGVLFLNTEEIVRCEAKGGYTQVYVLNGKTIITPRNLKEIETLLPSSFLRVHNSWVINTRYLKKYYRGKNGYMEMEDGSTIAVSIRKKGKFLDFFGGDEKEAE